MSSNKQLFINGSFWTAFENIVFMLLGVIQLYVTSKLLTPEDFGVYAVALFFSSLGTTAFSMGLGPALIHKKGDISEYIDVSWTANIGIASIASIILILLSPLICGWYFHNTTAVWPAIVIILNVVLSAGTSPTSIYSQREIKLKKYFYMRVVPKIVSFTLLMICAYVTRSFWALIIALLSEYLVRFIYSYYLFPYKPKFVFNKTKFMELYSFGGWLQLKNVMAWLVSNLDVAVVGNLLGPQKLGYFNRSQSLSGYPRSFVDGVINSVAFPLYSKTINGGGNVQVVIDNILNIILLALSSFAVIIILYAKDVVDLVLGVQWTDMAESFKWLFIAYLMTSLIQSFNPVLRAFGNTRQEFTFYIVKIVVLLTCLYPLTYYFGLMGTSLAMIAAECITLPYMLYIVTKKTTYKIINFCYSFIIAIFSVCLTYVLMIQLPLNGRFIWVLYSVIALSIMMIIFITIGRVLKVGPGISLVVEISSLLSKRVRK